MKPMQKKKNLQESSQVDRI